MYLFSLVKRGALSSLGLNQFESKLAYDVTLCLGERHLM